MNDQPTDIQVVRGSPSDLELAAAVAVVQSALAAAEQDAASGAVRKSGQSSWNRNHSMLRSQITAAAGQWSASMRDGLK